jgi:hypothetical protein
MEPYCTLKVAKHLFKNKGCYHHNANERFGFNHDWVKGFFFKNIATLSFVFTFFPYLCFFNRIVKFNFKNNRGQTKSWGNDPHDAAIL